MSTQDSKNSQKILDLLKKEYPNAKIILNYSNEWELLVAVILSAQCTDVMVNKVTKKLFKKYRSLNLSSRAKRGDLKSKEIASSQAPRNDSSRLDRTITPETQEIINFAEVPIAELEQDIRSTGFYKNKANNIRVAAKLVLEQFNGVLPRTMNELTKLPGVARKTANVVLGNAFGILEGIAVDTHVGRLSQRLGLSDQKDPNKIEQDLMKLYDKKDWFKLTYLLIEHGRKVCVAKKPKCDGCILNKLCPNAFKFSHFKNYPKDN